MKKVNLKKMGSFGSLFVQEQTLNLKMLKTEILKLGNNFVYYICLSMNL